MLQQTTVAAVVPRFGQFLRAFPTLATLAAAEEDEVLRQWEGLGYYRRARNLHQAARRLLAEHGGLPDNPEVWADLPGVGRYILGAVLSQAFDRRLPIVEANSTRVICRLGGQRADPKAGAVRRWLWHTAQMLLPHRHAGDFNQALMELGALVCTPEAPKCERCPVGRYCEAHRSDLQETIPRRSPPPAVKELHEVAVVIWRPRRVLLMRRPDRGCWANLWEFPHAERLSGESLEHASRRVASDLTGLRIGPSEPTVTIRHGIMQLRVTLDCVEAPYRSGAFRSPFYVESRWLRPADLARYAVSSPQRKLAKTLAAGPRQRRLF
jgi:A/G-specific adenine glycosylase